MKVFPFNILFIVLTILLVASIYFLQSYYPNSGWLSKDILAFLVFFAGTSFLAYQISMLGLKKGGESSILFILGGVTIKLLLSMVFAFIYVYTHKVDKVQFISNFFILYFIYTAFEIYSLMYNLRAQKII